MTFRLCARHSSFLQEAIQCVEELELGPQLHLFVRVGVESTLERSQITREHMGQLSFQLLRQGLLPKPQFIKGSVRPPEGALGETKCRKCCAWCRSEVCGSAVSGRHDRRHGIRVCCEVCK